MKNRLKKLSILQGKKRFIVMTWLAVELLSLPAAAQIVHRVAFDVSPIVTAVEIRTSEPGVSRYLVTSNSGFGVKTTGVIGEVQVDVHVSGTVNGVARFGDAAQLPGPKTGCAKVSSLSSNIYIAERKTAASPGTAPEQAVIFEFNYDANTQPVFEFVAEVEPSNALSSCSGATS